MVDTLIGFKTGLNVNYTFRCTNKFRQLWPQIGHCCSTYYDSCHHGHRYTVFNTMWVIGVQVRTSKWIWCYKIHGVRFKQYFDTRYFAFSNRSPPKTFLPLDLFSEYQIGHGTIEPLYVTSRYSTSIIYRKVSGFATDCPCGLCCRGSTICLLHVDSLSGNRMLNNSWAVGLP